jgi:phosphoglycerate dehydrogenase-like enzyme
MPALVIVPDDSPPVMADSAALLRLKRAPGLRVQVDGTRPAGDADLSRRIARADAVIGVHQTTQFTQAALVGARRLRLLVVLGDPTENADVEWAEAHGITVSRTPERDADAVAEHTLALMLSLARRVPELDQRVRAGEWPRGLVTQLGGKTLGVIGTSATGQKVARLATGIGMKVMAWSPEAMAADGNAPTSVGLELLLRTADVVSVHARQSEATGKLLGPRQFAFMKPGSLFIHTERSGLVDEAALAHALTGQLIGGAALDVFAQEPLPAESPLRHLANVILSPHAGASSAEVLESSLDAAAAIVLRFFGRRP